MEVEGVDMGIYWEFSELGKLERIKEKLSFIPRCAVPKMQSLTLKYSVIIEFCA